MTLPGLPRNETGTDARTSRDGPQYCVGGRVLEAMVPGGDGPRGRSALFRAVLPRSTPTPSLQAAAAKGTDLLPDGDYEMSYVAELLVLSWFFSLMGRPHGPFVDEDTCKVFRKTYTFYFPGAHISACYQASEPGPSSPQANPGVTGLGPGPRASQPRLPHLTAGAAAPGCRWRV